MVVVVVVDVYDMYDITKGIFSELRSKTRNTEGRLLVLVICV